MSLNTPEEIRKVWGSHLPLLAACIKLLRPTRIVECGCGDYSTPVLANGAPDVVVIEHDPTWAARTRQRAPNARWIVDPVPLTMRKFLKPGELEAIEGKYARWAQELKGCDLLFVDTTACVRVPAINALGPDAEAVVVHDTGGTSPDFYEYKLADLAGRLRYQLQPGGRVNGHAIEWTDLLTWTPLNLAEWRPVLDAESTALWGEPAPFQEVPLL